MGADLIERLRDGAVIGLAGLEIAAVEAEAFRAADGFGGRIHPHRSTVVGLLLRLFFHREISLFCGVADFLDAEDVDQREFLGGAVFLHHAVEITLLVSVPDAFDLHRIGLAVEMDFHSDRLHKTSKKSSIFKIS